MLGQRWIELNEIDQGEYDRFDLTREGSTNVICGNRVTDENVLRCVKLRGLPFSVTKQEVVDFFTGINLTTSDVTLDVQDGKNSGFAIVELHSVADKERALEMNKKSMGSRWIGVSQAEVMKRANKQMSNF